MSTGLARSAVMFAALRFDLLALQELHALVGLVVWQLGLLMVYLRTLVAQERAYSTPLVEA